VPIHSPVFFLEYTLSTRRSLIKGSTGLNTVVDPVRVDYDWRTGISDLAVAVNVSIDQSKRINRRTGRTLKQSGDCHSMFCDGGECVFAKDSKLYSLGSDLTSNSLLTSLSTNDFLSYAQVGDRIYYTNGLDLGYVEEGANNTWAKTTDYVGPTSRRYLEGPFAGNHLAYRDGRMFISKDNVVWYSEYLSVDWYRKAKNFIMLDSFVRMIKPVRDGIFVSTEKKIYFFHGETAPTFAKKTVASYPALEWSECIEYLDGESFPDLGFSGPCALWVTAEGAMVGSPTGAVKNLNREKVIYPSGTRGRSLVRGLNFIHTLE